MFKSENSLSGPRGVLEFTVTYEPNTLELLVMINCGKVVKCWNNSRIPQQPTNATNYLFMNGKTIVTNMKTIGCLKAMVFLCVGYSRT